MSGPRDSSSDHTESDIEASQSPSLTGGYVVAIDITAADVAAGVDAAMSAGELAHGVRDAFATLSRWSVLAPDNLRGSLSGEAADAYLTQCITTIGDAAARAARNGYGAFQWLWYLRRVPRAVLEGSLETTAPYDLSLAEVLATLAAPGDTVIFGFRAQAFVTRAYTAGIAGVETRKPYVANLWAAQGLAADWLHERNRSIAQ